MGICDFCSFTHVVKRFQCLDFESKSKDAGVFYPKSSGSTNLVFKCYDYWAACAPCACLIEAEDLDGLVNRVANEFCSSGHLVSNPLRTHLRWTYTLFLETEFAFLRDNYTEMCHSTLSGG
jgi:hypothetical protein